MATHWENYSAVWFTEWTVDSRFEERSHYLHIMKTDPLHDSRSSGKNASGPNVSTSVIETQNPTTEFLWFGIKDCLV